MKTFSPPSPPIATLVANGYATALFRDITHSVLIMAYYGHQPPPQHDQNFLWNVFQR